MPPAICRKPMPSSRSEQPMPRARQRYPASIGGRSAFGSYSLSLSCVRARELLTPPLYRPDGWTKNSSPDLSVGFCDVKLKRENCSINLRIRLTCCEGLSYKLRLIGWLVGPNKKPTLPSGFANASRRRSREQKRFRRAWRYGTGGRLGRQPF